MPILEYKMGVSDLKEKWGVVDRCQYRKYRLSVQHYTTVSQCQIHKPAITVLLFCFYRVHLYDIFNGRDGFHTHNFCDHYRLRLQVSQLLISFFHQFVWEWGLKKMINGVFFSLYVCSTGIAKWMHHFTKEILNNLIHVETPPPPLFSRMSHTKFLSAPLSFLDPCPFSDRSNFQLSSIFTVRAAFFLFVLPRTFHSPFNLCIPRSLKSCRFVFKRKPYQSWVCLHEKDAF